MIYEDLPIQNDELEIVYDSIYDSIYDHFSLFYDDLPLQFHVVPGCSSFTSKTSKHGRGLRSSCLGSTGSRPGPQPSSRATRAPRM